MKIFVITLTFLVSCLSINAQCWNLVWEDEFNGTQLDQTKWSYQVGGNGWGNAELQYYTDGDNIEVSNGTLKIIAEEDTGNQYPNNAYTSSRIRSINQGDWRYGKFEASIKLPEGQGIWPAFWMMPTESVYGGWPSSGEIDIMEYLGNDNNTIYGTCHYGFSPTDKNYNTQATSLSSGTFADGFHKFSVEWEPNQIRWYLDDVLFHTVSSAHPDFNYYNYPFDQKFHFILNVAVGGLWPGYPDATTNFPVEMEVEYVRVYQEINDLEIEGDLSVAPATQGVSYQLPNIAGASYNWSVPSAATLVSGQNTNEIIVDWNNSGGVITATITDACGSQNYSETVVISTNQWENFGFEDDLNFWNTNTFNGTSANFDIINVGSQEGDKHLCVQTNQLGANNWDIQLGRNINLVAGETYTLGFWAKSNTAGADVDVFFLNASNYSIYANDTFSLTSNWVYYTFTFTATATASALFTIDLGDESATTCFDNFFFSNEQPVQTLQLSFKTMLEGYMESTGFMRTDLNTDGLLPAQQIFNTSPWNYTNSEQYTFLPPQGVDWVLINVYDANENLLESQAGIVYLNGDVYDVNISNTFNFNTALADAKYVSIHHKSHLAVVADVTGLNGTVIDFTQAGTALGVQQTKTVNGAETMISGDFDGNGIINNVDFNIWTINSAAVNQYLPQDADGNGTINNTDFNFWTINRSKVGNTIIAY